MTVKIQHCQFVTLRDDIGYIMSALTSCKHIPYVLIISYKNSLPKLVMLSVVVGILLGITEQFNCLIYANHRMHEIKGHTVPYTV